jgi:hypothetical protein
MDKLPRYLVAARSSMVEGSQTGTKAVFITMDRAIIPSPRVSALPRTNPGRLCMDESRKTCHIDKSETAREEVPRARSTLLEDICARYICHIYYSCAVQVPEQKAKLEKGADRISIFDACM